MNKFLLLSVILASLIIPARAARMKNGRNGLKTTLKQMAIFNLLYLLTLIFVWGRF